MKKLTILLVFFFLFLSSLMATSALLGKVISKIGQMPEAKSVSIVWSSSLASFGSVQINHRGSRFYEYFDLAPGDSKYVKLLYYPREIAGNAILSIEKEQKTYAYEAGSNIAKEIKYIPPKAFLSFYIPLEYELLDETLLEDGSKIVLITDGVMDYRYSIGEDDIPTMLVINDHENGKLITKKEYIMFSSNHAYGKEFLVPISPRAWFVINPYDTYVQSSRDTLITEFPDDVFTLDFLESL